MDCISYQSNFHSSHHFLAQREVSHGWQHMDCVRENSLKIWETEKIQYSGNPEVDVDYVTTLIIAVAQLHDVADHKVRHVMENENPLQWILLQFHNALFTSSKRPTPSMVKPLSNWRVCAPSSAGISHLKTSLLSKTSSIMCRSLKRLSIGGYTGLPPFGLSLAMVWWFVW